MTQVGNTPHGSLWRDFDDAERALAHAGEGVGDEWIEAGLWDRQFHYHAAAGWNGDGLVADLMVGRVAIGIGVAEDGPDHMEGREESRPGVDDEDADALPRLRRQRGCLILVDVAVENDIVGNAGIEFGRVGGIRTIGQLRGVELALHQHVLLSGRPALRWIDDNGPVHAVGHVIDDGRRATVVHEDAGIVSLPVKGEALAGSNFLIVDVPGRLGGVEVNRVRHRAIVYQREVDDLALAHANDRAGNGAVKGPGMVGNAGSNGDEKLLDGQRHVNLASLWGDRRVRIIGLVIGNGDGRRWLA